MSTPSFTLHESALDPEAVIWFAEPPGFTALPLNVLLAPRPSPPHDELRALLAPVLDSAPDATHRRMLLAQVAAAQQWLMALGEVGTAHCAIGLHRDDLDGLDDPDDPDDPDEPNSPQGLAGDPRPSGGTARTLLSLFTLTLRDIAPAPPTVTAARAVTSGGQPPHSRIEYVDGLPCGPVTLSETVRVPPPGSGPCPQELLQLHAHLPHPDGTRLAVFTLSTPAVERREAYRSLLRHVVETAGFENPLARARP